MSSASSPCAACKFLRRKCTRECILAPYFPPDNPQKFTNVHRVFGHSNIAKLLNELNASQREDAVNSLAYEAEYRLRDPVYGCVGLISFLQQKLKQVHHDLDNAKNELANYIGPNAVFPLINQQGLMQPQSSYVYQGMPYHIQQQQQQQMLEAEQMFMNYEQLQNDLVRSTLGSYEGNYYGHQIEQQVELEHSHSHQPHQHEHLPHELLLQQHTSAIHQRTRQHQIKSEEGRSIDH